jgi:hypothetical protein
MRPNESVTKNENSYPSILYYRISYRLQLVRVRWDAAENLDESQGQGLVNDKESMMRQFFSNV